jgi:hypothetical protein
MANGTLFLEYRQMAEEGRRAYLDPKERFMIVREEEEKSVELMAGVSFTPELRFEPRFQTLAQWKNRAWAPDRLDMAAVIFGGKLTLGGEIAFEASAEVSDPYTTGKMYLWKKPRTMKFKYLVGAVPVYQEVMLNFVCEADFQPKAALEMSAEMTMTKDVKCAIRWTRGLGWNTSKTDGFERSVSYSVKVKGGAVFNFKIYPEVSVRFYRTLTGTLAVKPKLTLNAEMEADLLDLAMSQFTKFDLGIGADVQMGAKFACFSKSVAEKETDDIEILAPINFFTLPELEFVDPPNSGDLNKEIPLQVKITDGTNNKFDQLSATWFVSPNTNTILTPVGVTEIGKGEYTDDAKLTATANNTYNVYYSMQGNGFLGEMGKRIVKTPITLGADDLAKCDSIDVRLWNRNVPVTYEWTQHEATDTETTYHCLIDYISADYFNGERFERDKVKWSGKNFSYSYDGTTLPGQSGQIIRTGTSASGDTRFKISINGSIDASGNLSGTFSLRSDNYSPDFSATEYDIYQADFTLANVPLAESELIDVGGGTGDMLMVYRYKIYSSTASAQVSMSGAVWNDLHPYDNGSGTWLSTDWSKAKDEPVGWVHLYYYYKK